ncbi:fibroblast growth factor 2-like isoform X1 [Montipora capricornis]|uniref:fibroblast growth factor 2-like n=1 Tax=Montipora foliosa TaxID=591990 RepID=UPI0035F18E47
MLHIGTWYSTRIIAITFLLSSLSLGFSAKRQDYKENARSNPLHSKSSNPANLLKSAVRSEICEGSSPPILPPSFILPSFYLWSRRAMMLLQILPDGSINGTLTFGPYAKLNIEIVGKCMVRLQGVVSQRYLVMETNGTLVSKAEPDEEKSIFTYQLQKDFYTFKNGKYFIAFKQGGKLKRVKANESGRNPRKHTRFVLFSNGLSRKRRYPSQLFGADIQ